MLALGAVLLLATLSATVDGVFARRIPDLALLANPFSAEARVRRAEAVIAVQPKAVGGAQVRALAVGALMRQPVNAPAARLLGLSDAARGQARALAAMNYALLLSRRDLLTQVWFIEISVSRGDVARALDHYDQALVTNDSAYDMLLPILAAAASQPAIAGPLSQHLSHRPRWTRLFLRQFIPVASSPATLARLAFSGGLADRPSLDAGLLQDAERRLVTLGGYREAGRLYARAHGAADPATEPLRNGGFDVPNGGEPFDWNLRDDPNLGAAQLNAPDGGRSNALFITAANGRGGDVAQQLMLLGAGRYTLSAKVGSIAGDPLSYPQMLIRCDRTNAEFLHTKLPASPSTGKHWKATFEVPASCHAQWLVIQAASPLEPQQEQPWIGSVAIEAAR